MTQQMDLFGLLFPAAECQLCKNLNEATKNDCGVFVQNKVMFQGGSLKEGNRVVISIAKKAPFIYFAFDYETKIQGRGSPCTEDVKSRFNVTDNKDDVMTMMRERLTDFCEGIGIKQKNIDKALTDMRNFI